MNTEILPKEKCFTQLPKNKGDYENDYGSLLNKRNRFGGYDGCSNAFRYDNPNSKEKGENKMMDLRMNMNAKIIESLAELRFRKKFETNETTETDNK